MDENVITKAASAIADINATASRFDTSVRQTLDGGAAWDSYQVAALAQTKVREANAELSQRQAMLLAEQAQEQIEKTIEQYELQIDAANEGFKGGMDLMYSMAGYSISGSGYDRDLVVGSTVMTPRVTEHSFVLGYQDYDAPDIELDGLDLTR